MRVVARSQSKAGKGLFAAARGFIEDGAIDFGSGNVTVVLAIAERGAKREGKEFGLGEKAEID